MRAFAAHDGERMRALLADDALLVNDYGIAVPDDYVGRAEWDRLTNTTITDVACELLTPDRVSCLFEIQNSISRHLRSSGHDAEVIVTVRDGVIVGVQSAVPFTVEEDLEFFLDWLGRTHPEDLEEVVDESTLRTQIIPESGAVIADRTLEFAETTPPSIERLVADDPRFATLAEGLERTGVDELLALCSGGSLTVFAPTNDAFDRFIASSGLDRDTVLADVRLFESLVGEGEVELSGTAGLGGQPIDIETRSGETITVSGGSELRVQGVPILADFIDLEACNGTLNGIDDIYSRN
jgi:hypothetical protein